MAPEAYLTRSGLTRAKRRCRGRGLSRDLCMRTTMLLSNYPCTPKISSRGHHEWYCTKKSEPEVLSSSNNCIYLVPRGLERLCDLLILKCSLWAAGWCGFSKLNPWTGSRHDTSSHPGTKSLASSGSITELQLGEIVVNEFTSRPKLLYGGEAGINILLI